MRKHESDTYQGKSKTAEEALAPIRSGQHLFVGQRLMGNPALQAVAARA